MPSDIRLNESDVDVVGPLNLKRSEQDDVSIRLNPASANIRLDREGSDGDVWLEDARGDVRIEIDSGSSRRISPDTTRIYLDGREARVSAGGDRQEGEILLRDSSGKDRIRLQGGKSTVESVGASLRRTARPRILVTVDKDIGQEVLDAMEASPLSGFSGVVRIDETDLESRDIPELTPREISEAATFEIDLVETIVDLRRQVAALQAQIDELSDG